MVAREAATAEPGPPPGRPELANPAVQEEARRLVDVTDQVP